MSQTRRDFLKASLQASTLVSLGPTVPLFLSRSALAGASRRDANDTVLVVVQLAGGNDGLNAVVPYDNDDYARARPTLRLEANQLHRIGQQLGFHPQMEAFARLHKEGLLGIVQGVGYPNPQGGHNESMHVWQTARLDTTGCQTGWLGRAIDQAAHPTEGTVPGIFVGNIAPPFTLHTAKTVVPAIGSLADCTVRSMPGTHHQAHRGRLVSAAKVARHEQDNPLLDLVQRSTLNAYAASERIESMTLDETTASAPDYPPIEAARMLRTVAQLIRADLGIRIFYTELGGAEPGGFDNHANQRDNHGALLHQLSESVAAFVHDLQRDTLLDRVLLMTFSEFGRTVAENGRRGTGHGSAAPVFLAGGKLAGGLLGPHPSLTELENGGPKHHTDFRRLYATVLDRWLGFDSRPVLGETFDPLEVLRT